MKYLLHETMSFTTVPQNALKARAVHIKSWISDVMTMQCVVLAGKRQRPGSRRSRMQKMGLLSDGSVSDAQLGSDFGDFLHSICRPKN